MERMRMRMTSWHAACDLVDSVIRPLKNWYHAGN